MCAYKAEEIGKIAEHMGRDAEEGRVEVREERKVVKLKRSRCFEREVDGRHHSHRCVKFYGLKECYKMLSSVEEMRGE